MVQCRLSRRVVVHYANLGKNAAKPNDYAQCILNKDSVRKTLKPEELDSRPGLSDLERLCFEAAWQRFAINDEFLHADDLDFSRADLSASFGRLSQADRPIQNVRVVFEIDRLIDELGLTKPQADSLKRRVIELIRAAYESDGPLPLLKIAPAKMPSGDSKTTVVITDKNFEEVLYASSKVRLRALLDYVYPTSPLGKIEEIEELKFDYNARDALPSELVARDLREREKFIFTHAKEVGGHTIWEGLEHYLTPEASEFGNPTLDETCYVYAKDIMEDLLPPEEGIAMKNGLDRLAWEIAGVAVHELGHAFGLSHEEKEITVMSRLVRSSHSTFSVHSAFFNEGEKEYLRTVFRGVK